MLRAKSVVNSIGWPPAEESARHLVAARLVVHSEGATSEIWKLISHTKYRCLLVQWNCIGAWHWRIKLWAQIGSIRGGGGEPQNGATTCCAPRATGQSWESTQLLQFVSLCWKPPAVSHRAQWSLGALGTSARWGRCASLHSMRDGEKERDQQVACRPLGVYPLVCPSISCARLEEFLLIGQIIRLSRALACLAQFDRR